ncbi:tetratricopeptide repeat protein 28-like [Pocillopora verrucosa]|uniref:tetratricopeptide repeat protein 28-like n=1 Tax=Pocillopora verrucosa TaxID=203993 RepID=UPI00333F1981
MEIDTLIAAFVCDAEDIFKKSASTFGIKYNENCEDRSLGDEIPLSPQEESREPLQGDETKRNKIILQLCYDQIIAPVKDLLTEPEVIIVPERCSYRVPFAALRDEPAGKYLSETHRIRIVPSLTTLRIIQECPADYHSQTGALVVGDPKAGYVQYRGRPLNLVPLSGARKEAEMVGRLLGVQPLLGEHATKQAVLHVLHSASLIHLAAHGHADRGEIALSPNCTTNGIPQEEDYLLTMSDISKVKLRAKLVVLSCCHSGRGTFKQEGVIGIARAFLASGARSVLVASWTIQDEATEQLMNHFYERLAAGESASESLHQAMKWLRSNGFTEPRQWAPFVLMGDNVTFDLQKLRQKEPTEDENEGDKRQSSD